MTQAEFEQCLHIEENGDVIALFNGLVFRSVYQPIFRADQTVLGFEALLRATNEDGETVCPAHIFRNLDRGHPDYYKQISIDKLARVIHLRNFSRCAGTYSIFLNMLPSSAVASIANFSSQKLMLKRLKEIGIPRRHVVLEVVEHLHDDPLSLSVAAEQSISSGFKIAVDDYGVEGSKESRVRMINPNVLKIDRSMLERYMTGETTPLMEAITLANEVNAKVLVEGIENLDEYNAMRLLNVDYYQGYFLGMPQSIEAFFSHPQDFITIPQVAEVM